jgi:hypothetical protein
VIDGRLLAMVLHAVGGDEHAVFGSTALVLHGLDLGREPSDVDVFVREHAYRRLRDVLRWREDWPRAGDPPVLEGDIDCGVLVHAFRAWSVRDPWVDMEACLRLATPTAAGLRAIPPWLVAVHKRQALHIVRGWGVQVAGSRWEKHERDLERLAGSL